MANFSTLKKDFLLDSSIVYLNHGSFGATPRPVFDSYQNWQRLLETQPVDFLGRRSDNLLYQSRTELATYLDADPMDLVYISNATQGVNIVARSFQLHPGDIVLSSNHEYGAMDRTWRYLAERDGFEYKTIEIPTPIPSDSEIVDLFFKQFNPHTKILFLSHITSPTAVIFPVHLLCKAAREKGILTVIDGAHAPGQIPLDLSNLEADFYIGNLHKWLCAPKGSAFLWANRAFQHLIEPLIVSWGYESENPSNSHFIDLLQWTGTRDISAFLAVPDAIRYQQEHNWSSISHLCHEKAIEAESSLTEITAQISIYSNSDQFGQMFSFFLPDRINLSNLKSILYDQFKIEVPLMNWNNRYVMRVSLQAYNSDEDIQYLEKVITQLL